MRLNQFSSQANYDPLPHQLMWKYIAYARKNVNNIKISKEACQVKCFIKPVILNSFMVLCTFARLTFLNLIKFRLKRVQL